jgi:hypothetical protein
MPFVRISMMKGKSIEFRRRLNEHLHNELEIPMEDVFVNLVGVKKENSSFGYGIAQYVGVTHLG